MKTLFRTLSITFVTLALSPSVLALEASVAGMIDLRAIASDSSESYSQGGLGKLRYDDDQIALGQLALVGDLTFSETLSLKAVGNSFVDDARGRTGITELFFRYRGLPDDSGLRQGLRAGLYYPPISLENNAVAWSSPNTLTPSTLNSWIGEEIRLTGIEYSAQWLGKITGKPYNLQLTGSLFINNDPAGAMLSWHGWTQSSRQTVVGETLPITALPALNNGALARQARGSDPFHEEDNNPGVTVNALWHWPKQDRFQLGYYHNNATPYKETEGQYGWQTRFAYAGFQKHLNKQWQISGQILQGDTLMQSHHREDVVNNDYRSAYLTLSWRHKNHRVSGRLEEFQVWDNDPTTGDNNTEYGTSQTLSYRYRISKQWFMLTEYNRINSRRPARMYIGEQPEQLEQQLQFGLRYYF